MKKKVNLKLLLILAIVLLAICVFNRNIVNAESVTATDILDSIPDTINVDFPTTEAISETGPSGKIMDSIQKYYITKDTSEYSISIWFADFDSNNLQDISKIKISIYEKSTYKVVAEKTITVKYNDKNWNESDKKYIEDKIKSSDIDLNNMTLDIESDDAIAPKSAPIFNCISKGYAKQINDSSINYEFVGNHGIWSLAEGYSMAGNLKLSKNGVIYFMLYSGQQIEPTPMINVPQNIENTDKAIIDYILPRVKAIIEKENQDAYEKIDINNVTIKKDEKTNKFNIYNGETIINSIVVNRITNTKTEVTDKETNVKLEATEGVIPTNTTLAVEPIKEGTTYNQIKEVLKDTKSFVVFDINLMNNGEKIQPNGKVKISVPIPEGFDTSKLVVYRIEEDGTKIEYSVKVTTIDNIKYAQFETDHFSNYALAEKVINNTPTTNKTEKDNTPKTGTVDVVTYVVIVTVISTVGIILSRKERDI